MVLMNCMMNLWCSIMNDWRTVVRTNCQICGDSQENTEIRKGSSNSLILRIPRCLRKIYSLDYGQFVLGLVLCSFLFFCRPVNVISLVVSRQVQSIVWKVPRMTWVMIIYSVTGAEPSEFAGDMLSRTKQTRLVKLWNDSIHCAVFVASHVSLYLCLKMSAGQRSYNSFLHLLVLFTYNDNWKQMSAVRDAAKLRAGDKCGDD